MNKKAQLVAIIAVIIAALVLFWIFPKFMVLLKGAGTSGTCNFNMLLTAMTQTVPGKIVTGFQSVPLECKAEYVTIDRDALTTPATLAKKRTNKYCGTAAKQEQSGYVGLAATTQTQVYADAAAEFCDPTLGKPTFDTQNEWAMDYIIAKKMTECWNKVWHGKLDVFDRQIFYNRRFCIVCSVISFSDDLPVTLNPAAGKKIDSLYEWMKTEPYYETTYYDFLHEGQSGVSDKQELSYFTDKPLAIVFLHAKKNAVVNQFLTSGVILEISAIATAAMMFTPAAPLVAATGLGVGVINIATGAVWTATDDIIKVGIVPYEALLKDPPGGAGCTDVVA